MEKRFPKTILLAACIPWTEDFQLDVEKFKEGVRLLCENGAGAIYLFGTAGEGYAVSREQYMQIVTEFMDTMKDYPQIIPIVGVISTSMSEDIERIKMARDIGVRHFQISFPCWGVLDLDEILEFFRTVCGTFPDCSFMHYNNGPRAKRRLSPKEYVRIAEEVPNLVAVKNPGPSFSELHEIAKLNLPLRFYLLEHAYGYGSMISDEFGFLASGLNCSYQRMREYYHAGIEKDYETIMKVHDEVTVLYDVLFSNVPAGRIDATYDKLFVKFCMPDFPARLLPPYHGASEEQAEKFVKELREKLPGWI